MLITESFPFVSVKQVFFGIYFGDELGSQWNILREDIPCLSNGISAGSNVPANHRERRLVVVDGIGLKNPHLGSRESFEQMRRDVESSTATTHYANFAVDC